MNSIIMAVLTVGMLGTVAILGLGTSQVDAKGAYDSGFDHGCDDSNKSYSDRYINEDGKGPSFHTDDFMRGYNAGVNCSSNNDDDNDNNSNSNSNDNDNDRSFLGTSADGYEEGRQEGRSDWYDRSNHNSKCPPNDSFAWCAGYTVGYEVGWSSGGR